jgi:transposase InsO family protein
MATMRERQRAVQLYRGHIPSPGRPGIAWREDRVKFWAAIARGLKSDDAGVEAGISSPVAYRWFRHAGRVAFAIVTWIEHTYNRRRRQRALGKLTPVEFELAFADGSTLAA